MKPIALILLTGMVVCNVYSANIPKRAGKSTTTTTTTTTKVAPIPVIFDTDMGNDVDDALALDMLYKYHQDKKINLLGVVSNKDAEHSTVFVDIMNNFYGLPTLPIGKIYKGAVCVRENEYSLVVASDTTWKKRLKTIAICQPATC